MALIEIYERMQALAPTWDAIFATAEGESIFFSRAWFELLASAALPTAQGVRIYAAESDAGDPAALLLMGHACNRGWWSPQVLSALANFYTPLFAPLLAPAATPDALRGIIRAIADERRWDIVDLQPLALEEPTFTALETAFAACGYLTQRYFRFGNWYLKVDGRSFAEYQVTLPAPLRNTLKRKAQRLTASHEVRVTIVTGQEGLDAGIAAYQVVYGSSWKTAEPYGEFVTGLISLAAADGSLRLGTLHVDGQPAAAQLWLVSHGTAAIYKLAHDERFAGWSVGSQLTLALMRHVLDVDKVQEVDYLTGDDTYKRNWMSHRRERWGLAAFDPRRPRGLAAALYHFGGRAFKKALALRRS
jgi:CelD/BcsL family acetyltransferase involved in cellulose biosynthesis